MGMSTSWKCSKCQAVVVSDTMPPAQGCPGQQGTQGTGGTGGTGGTQAHAWQQTTG